MVIMNWTAVWVKSRHEKSVQRYLDAQGVTSFLPLYSALHRWTDRNKVVNLPVFPNYVFCAFGSEYPPYLGSIPGVVDYVRCGAAVARIDHHEIDALKRTVTAGYRLEPAPMFLSGQWVEITAGPLAGLTGTVVEHKSRLKLVLTVTLLQRSVLVEISPTVLRVMGPMMAVPPVAPVEGLLQRRFAAR